MTLIFRPGNTRIFREQIRRIRNIFRIDASLSCSKGVSGADWARIPARRPVKLGERRIERPVSRVLCPRPKSRRRPFLWDADRSAPRAVHPGGWAEDQPSRASPKAPRRPPLFDLASGGACHAPDVSAGAVGSYPTVSPLLQRTGAVSFSVALSLSFSALSGGLARRTLSGAASS